MILPQSHGIKLRFYNLNQFQFGRYLIFITAVMWLSPVPGRCHLCCPLDGGCREISRCRLITLMNYLRRSPGWAAAGQLGRCWPRYIKLRLILLSCYGYWTNGHSGHGSRPHTDLSSFLFIWLLHSHNNIFASLKVASHPRLPIRFGTGDWVMKIFAKRLCAMCNVNNVLQPGHWAAPADKCSHLGMLSGDCCCLPCLGQAPAQMEQNGEMAQLCKLNQGKHRN